MDLFAERQAQVVEVIDPDALQLCGQAAGQLVAGYVEDQEFIQLLEPPWETPSQPII